MQTETLTPEIYPNRPGHIFSDTIYSLWCDICDEHLGDYQTYQEASIALTDHLDSEHPDWTLTPKEQEK